MNDKVSHALAQIALVDLLRGPSSDETRVENEAWLTTRGGTLRRYIAQQQASESASSDTVSRAEHESAVKEAIGSSWDDGWKAAKREFEAQLTEQQAEHERVVAELRNEVETERHNASVSEKGAVCDRGARDAIARERDSLKKRVEELESKLKAWDDLAWHCHSSGHELEFYAGDGSFKVETEDRIERLSYTGYGKEDWASAAAALLVELGLGAKDGAAVHPSPQVAQASAERKDASSAGGQDIQANVAKTTPYYLIERTIAGQAHWLRWRGSALASWVTDVHQADRYEHHAAAARECRAWNDRNQDEIAFVSEHLDLPAPSPALPGGQVTAECTCDPEDTGPTGHMLGCPKVSRPNTVDQLRADIVDALWSAAGGNNDPMAIAARKLERKAKP